MEHKKSLNEIVGLLNSQAEEASKSPLEKLRERVITADTPVPKEDVVLWLDDKAFMTKGDVSFIAGQAGTGKSFLVTLLVAQMLNSTDEKFASDLKPNERVAWFDTEQKKQHIVKIAKRLRHFGVDDRVDVFEQRSVLSPTDRFEEFKAFVNEEKPPVVVLDGLTDYMVDPNDLKEAAQIMGELLLLSQEAQACIICVVHMNESGGIAASKKMRGHVGSEGQRKAENVVGIELGDGCFNVERIKTRNEPWSTWSFKIENVDGLAVPRILKKEELPPTPEMAAEIIGNRLLDEAYAKEVFIEIGSRGAAGKGKFIDMIRDWAYAQPVNGVAPKMTKSKATDIFQRHINNGLLKMNGSKVEVVTTLDITKSYTPPPIIQHDDLPF